MTWYLTDLARWKDERTRLEQLAQEAEWFRPIGWRMDDNFRLVFEADIAAGGRIYPVILRYPSQFPYTPPSVFPRGDDTRWSNHQFGAGGELCLEHGPDNWTPDLSGVLLIRSAQRLLDGENPPSGEAGTVASRHATTLGQRLRAERTHLLITRPLSEFLAGVPVAVPYIGNLLGAFHKEMTANFIDRITAPDGTTWNDASIPAHISYELWDRPITIFRIPHDATFAAPAKLSELKVVLAELGLTIEHTHVLILRGPSIREFYLDGDKDAVIERGIIPPQPEAQRQDSGHAGLKDKHVALIGCGSLGSKFGTILARAGVGHFLLVDEDILLPENLVRNDLDWRDAATHKSDALARRMQLVNPDVRTQVRRMQLAGQESSSSAETLLNTIAQCDLIVDATANPNALNLLSAFAAGAKKPLIWAEVFGGGIGGLIARSRPGLEPAPQYMRRAIENWFAETGAAPVRVKRRYETGEEGDPLIADDADVSVIAAHAARLAIDLLIGREPSIFPNSVYVIGLAPGSVFSRPFETFPIDVGPVPPEEDKPRLTDEEAAEEVAGILKLLKPPNQ